MKLLLLIIVSNSACFAQSAKDYFLPASGKNLSIYGVPKVNGMERNNAKTQVYVKDMGDSALITTSYSYDHQKTPVWTEQLVKIEPTRITLIKVRSNNYERKSFNEGEVILFETPGGNEPSLEQFQRGSLKQSRTLEYSTLKINGEEQKAIKISKKSEMARSGKQVMAYAEYYVQGIGLYKRTTDDGIDIEILEDQKYDPSPPPVK
jgi:hypothetical protein